MSGHSTPQYMDLDDLNELLDTVLYYIEIRTAEKEKPCPGLGRCWGGCSQCEGDE